MTKFIIPIGGSPQKELEVGQIFYATSIGYDTEPGLYALNHNGRIVPVSEIKFKNLIAPVSAFSIDWPYADPKFIKGYKEVKSLEVKF